VCNHPSASRTDGNFNCNLVGLEVQAMPAESGALGAVKDNGRVGMGNP
jgi:hypothetical protein